MGRRASLLLGLRALVIGGERVFGDVAGCVFGPVCGTPCRASGRVARGVVSSLIATAVVVSPTSCASHDDTPMNVHIAPAIVFPRGLLDSVTSLSLDVYDQTTTLTCDASTGTVAGLASSPKALVSTTDFATTCTNGARFCATVSVVKADTPRVLSVRAFSKTHDVVASGCVAQKISVDTVNLTISMVRAVPPSTCGDGVIGATEQCEPANDGICDAACHSTEETLSTGVSGAIGPAALLWPAQTGDAGRFFAFFTSFTSGNANADVTLRALSDTLAPLATPSALKTAILLPNDPNTFPPAPAIGNQGQPSAAFANSLYWVAFTDDATADPDIHLRSFDLALAAQQAPGAAVGVNGTNGAGEPNKQTTPAIALGPGGKLLVAWQDETGPSAGQVMARLYDPAAAKPLGDQNQISTGTQNRNVTLAATSTGWLAVWESGSDVKLRAIDGNGTPSGPEQQVNDANVHHGVQDHPRIAVLTDGRAGVTWTDHGAAGGAEIIVQRFDRDLAKVASDQTTPVNDLVSTGDQVAPAIAATSAAGGAFVVAWLDAASGHVRARYLGASSGAMLNFVNGQNSEFQASLTESHVRANPAVAIGGGGFVAIGWDDTTSASLVVRRFPLPATF